MPPPPRIWPLAPLVSTFQQVRAQTDSRRTSLPTLPPSVLDSATDDELAHVLCDIALATLPLAFHVPIIRERIGFLRHALNHLYRGADPLPDRLARCILPGEVYSVAGLGVGFWSAILPGVKPGQLPRWCPAVEQGLRRLGLLREGPTDGRSRLAAILRAYEVLREQVPEFTASDIDEFLVRVARMSQREFPREPLEPSAAFAWTVTVPVLQQAIREVRLRTPLRARLRQCPPEQAERITQFHHHAHEGHWSEALAAFRQAFPEATWEAALPALDDAYSTALPEADRARLWCEVARVLRERFRVHPLELPEVVVAARQAVRPDARTGEFAGFCTDTFAFLAELQQQNSKDWMATQRPRYHFVLREPLIELCEALAERYIRPVLNREHGWGLECDAKTGRTITRICKNDFGRSRPYQPVQWITFYRQTQAHKQADAQLFVRIAADGVAYGFHLGRAARDAGKQFRKNLQEHGEALFRALEIGNVFTECRFWTNDDCTAALPVKTAADLRAWAVHKTIAVGKWLPPETSLLRHDELVGEILLTFDRLLPCWACAVEADPRAWLARRAGRDPHEPLYDAAAFRRETYLSEVWLDRVLGLLRLKKQLVLQGVPGTGKTHVARCLARLLTHNRPECVRLVQFHPAYSYEEFVEGIRARGVEVNGRREVSFPVEDGVLCEFAHQAALRPSEPHVLIIDELNRGHLPRIFGELLYLLEYRDHAVTLPYSKREFRLPDNLFLLATMNPLDRSAMVLDQALRRRFSFVEMPADAAILAAWLEAHPPGAAGDETFGLQVVRLFEELNFRLARDLGPDKQIGHSFFMIPGLDAEQLAAVWEHHVGPLLRDYWAGREDRLREYAFERLWNRSSASAATLSSSRRGKHAASSSPSD